MINETTKFLPKVSVILNCFHIGENFLIDENAYESKIIKENVFSQQLFFVLALGHILFYICTIQLFPISTVRLTHCVN